MLFVQISILPPTLHQFFLIKHGRCCTQNNQLLTKSHLELKDKYNRKYGEEDFFVTCIVLKALRCIMEYVSLRILTSDYMQFIVCLQDDQPDIQGLAVTLIGGRSTTESAIGIALCTIECVLFIQRSHVQKLLSLFCIT